jgi:bacteriocin biosynthesis cyclodehydratase domain-containing protein
VGGVRHEPVPSLPYLAPWYHVANADRKVVLEHAQRVVSLEGKAADRLLPVLLPLLDGRRTVDEIVDVLGQAVRPAVEHTLALLAGHGVLDDGPPLPDDLPRPVAATAALLASLRPGAGTLAGTAEALAACSVGVAGNGEVAAEIARVLRASGIGVKRTSGVERGVDLTICAPSGDERTRLEEWNAQALAVGDPWLQLLAFDGRYAAVGPLYLPGDTCCYECFRLRRRAGLGSGTDFALVDQAPSDCPAAPALDVVLAGLASLVVSTWLVQRDHYTPGTFLAVELLPTLAVSGHYVYRVPRCPVCSGLADTAPPLPWHKEVEAVDR